MGQKLASSQLRVVSRREARQRIENFVGNGAQQPHQLFTNFREIVTPEAAAESWEMRPSADRKVVPIAAWLGIPRTVRP
jgi:hypothetical protein